MLLGLPVIAKACGTDVLGSGALSSRFGVCSAPTKRPAPTARAVRFPQIAPDQHNLRKFLLTRGQNAMTFGHMAMHFVTFFRAVH